MDYKKELRIKGDLVIMTEAGIFVYLSYVSSPLGGSCLDCYRYSYKEAIGKSPQQLCEESWEKYRDSLWDDSEIEYEEFI